MSRAERNRTLRTEYDDYTVWLALFDAVPVILFMLSGLVIYSMFGSRLFMAGVLMSFAGGMCKVIWKLIAAVKKRNYALLTFLFHLLLPAGFILMMLSVVIPAAKQGASGVELRDSIAAQLWRSLTMQPAVWCFLAGFAGLCLMGYLSVRMDDSARASWIEQSINTLAQLAILAGVILVYTGTFYPASDAAAVALSDTDTVKVAVLRSDDKSAAGPEADEGDDMVFFDGPGNDSALVFYPGAKVEPASYAPLMKRISENGVDCFLCSMPANIALLDKDMAEDIKASYDYKKWYIGGHSLGGATAAMLVSDSEKASGWDGLILLAAYPTDRISVPTLSVYGSEDGVLNKSNYDKAAEEGMWPDDFTEVVIEGGNHAQFGDYGKQEGDGQASVSAEEQQRQTAEAIDNFVK